MAKPTPAAAAAASSTITIWSAGAAAAADRQTADRPSSPRWEKKRPIRSTSEWRARREQLQSPAAWGDSANLGIVNSGFSQIGNCESPHDFSFRFQSLSPVLQILQTGQKESEIVIPGQTAIGHGLSESETFQVKKRKLCLLFCRPSHSSKSDAWKATAGAAAAANPDKARFACVSCPRSRDAEHAGI